MDAIKLIGTSHKGKLTVLVPKEYDEKELEIMIVSSKEKNSTVVENTETHKKTDRLCLVADTANVSR